MWETFRKMSRFHKRINPKNKNKNLGPDNVGAGRKRAPEKNGLHCRMARKQRFVFALFFPFIIHLFINSFPSSFVALAGGFVGSLVRCSFALLAVKKKQQKNYQKKRDNTERHAKCGWNAASRFPFKLGCTSAILPTREPWRTKSNPVKPSKTRTNPVKPSKTRTNPVKPIKT